MDGAGLDSVELFADLSADDRTRIGSVLKAEEHPTGRVLVEEGDLPTKFYVILEGTVTVHRKGRHVVDLGPGDFFGEIGVLAMERRNATVIATTPLTAAVAMGWDLRRVLDELPAARRRLEEVAAGREPIS